MQGMRQVDLLKQHFKSFDSRIWLVDLETALGNFYEVISAWVSQRTRKDWITEIKKTDACVPALKLIIFPN